ncbi:MAG: hypothetical protein ACFFBI_15320 [Promethearchaeota archaeon]
MTVYKASVSLDHTVLTCDLCGSRDIIETTEGYVCKECAVVLTIRKLQYDRPYNDDVIQYAKGLGKTQIGTPRERLFSPNSRQLKRLNRHNLHTNNKELVNIKARTEISRILNLLNLPESCEDHIMEKFKIVRAKLMPGTKSRNPEKLSAILTYIVLKLKNIAINKKDVVDASKLTGDEFNNLIIQISPFIPEYANRDRQRYICQKIMEITEFFDVDMAFYFLSKKILYKLWESIKNTTDDVIAGLCASITALCKYKEDITVCSICNVLNIKMSTIQFQVKNRIFETFKVPGFTSLVRSSDLLKGFMKRVGLIESENLEVEVIPEEEEDVEGSLPLGNAKSIFNPLNDHYLLSTSNKNDIITLAYLEVHNSIQKLKHIKKTRKNSSIWFNLTLGEYFPSKGPPTIASL